MKNWKVPKASMHELVRVDIHSYFHNLQIHACSIAQHHVRGQYIRPLRGMCGMCVLQHGDGDLIGAGTRECNVSDSATLEDKHVLCEIEHLKSTRCKPVTH